MAATAAVLPLAVAGVATLASTPAFADDYACSGVHEKTFPTPGNDTRVEVKLCIDRGADGYQAYAYVEWWNGGDSNVNDDRKFDRFDVQIRVEQHASGSETVRGSRTCDSQYLINTTGTYGDDCGKYVVSNRTGTWSADGKIVYDIDRDGNGAYTWDLHGSPQID